MATLTKAVLGKVSGALGDVTFRQRNGRNYLATRPSNFTPAIDLPSIARRNQFAFDCKLSAGINSMPHLKTLWSAGLTDGRSVYNTIIRKNYKFVAADSITELTHLSPGIGFRVTTSQSEVGTEGITVVINPVGSNSHVDTVLEKSVELAAIVSLCDPIDNTVEGYAILPLVSQAQQMTVDAALSFAIPFSSQEMQLFQKYRVVKTMYALVTMDVNGAPVHYSSTFR